MKTPRTKETPRPEESYESHFDNTTLFEFSNILNSSLELKFILSHVLLTIMGKILSAKGMALLAHDKGIYSVEMVKGFTPDLAGKRVTIKRPPHTLTSLEKLDASRHPWVKFFRDTGVGFLLPVLSEERPIGLLGFGPRYSKRRLRSQERTYLRSLANISATAIAKSHTIEELQHVNRRLDRKIQELDTLFELGKEFNALLEQEKLIRLMIFSLMGQIGVSRYLICLKEGADMKIVASRLDGPDPHAELLQSFSSVRVPVCVSDMVVKHHQNIQAALQGLGLTVYIPMQIQQENKGMILLGDKMSKEPFSRADCEFLSALGNLAIISLENARLFRETIEKQKLEDELLIAREIQKGLLPGTLPHIDDIDIAAANISSKQVGGDYYDVIPLPDGTFVLAIGDVSGKGPPAALLMANLQATIRALVPLQLTISELTDRVNRLMCQNTGGSRFVTFFWGFLHPRAKTLTYVNAGHNYPYIVHEDGTHERLVKGGMILGIMEETGPYEQGTVSLQKGDRLVLFTDGVSEAMSRDSEEYGEHRLQAVVKKNRSLGAQPLLEAIQRDIQDHVRGAVQSDDVTMMILAMS
jgi:sigma-B regulation protein RsbU (phosphoserine phosphatase)